MAQHFPFPLKSSVEVLIRCPCGTNDWVHATIITGTDSYDRLFVQPNPSTNIPETLVRTCDIAEAGTHLYWNHLSPRLGQTCHTWYQTRWCIGSIVRLEPKKTVWIQTINGMIIRSAWNSETWQACNTPEHPLVSVPDPMTLRERLTIVMSLPLMQIVADSLHTIWGKTMRDYFYTKSHHALRTRGTSVLVHNDCNDKWLS